MYHLSEGRYSLVRTTKIGEKKHLYVNRAEDNVHTRCLKDSRAQMRKKVTPIM